VECINSLIQRGVDVNQRAGGTGTTALQSAAAYNRTEVMRILLEHGADPDRGDSENNMPLHTASYWGNVAAVRLLLDAGANVDPIESRFGSTPLMDAALKGHRDIVQLLLAAGAEPTRRESAGQTAEDKARQRGFHEVAGDIRAWAARRRPNKSPVSPAPGSPPRSEGSLRQVEGETGALIRAQYAEPAGRADERVVGRTFPLSPSARRECASPPALPCSCETAMRELAEFAEESRNQTWATRTEGSLRVGLASGSTAVTVRALECRRSLCAIETAVHAATYAGPEYSLLEANGSVEVEGVWARETDANRAGVLVLAQVFVRRPTAHVSDGP
jgi:hypothetical protein